MENQSTSKFDCGCSDGCCTPPTKSSPWKKWVFIAIILLAGAIVAIKFITKDDAEPAKCCENLENTSCSKESKCD